MTQEPPRIKAAIVIRLPWAGSTKNLQEEFVPYQRKIVQIEFPCSSFHDISRADAYVAVYSYAFHSFFGVNFLESKDEIIFRCANKCNAGSDGNENHGAGVKMPGCKFQLVFRRVPESYDRYYCSTIKTQEHTCSGAIPNIGNRQMRPLNNGMLIPYRIVAAAMKDAGWTTELVNHQKDVVANFCTFTFGLQKWGCRLNLRVKKALAELEKSAGGSRP
jgi:hypothetical protein